MSVIYTPQLKKKTNNRIETYDWAVNDRKEPLKWREHQTGPEA